MVFLHLSMITRLILSVFASVAAVVFLGACDQHSWDDTKHLHLPHGGHGDHSEHSGHEGSEKEHQGEATEKDHH